MTAIGAGHRPSSLWLLLWFVVIPLSLASDVLVRWVERRLIRRLSDAPSLPWALATVLVSVAAIGVVVLGPLLVGALSFAIHQTLWTLVLQPVYAAQRGRFLTHPRYKQWARVVGVAFLVYGSGIEPSAVLRGLTRAAH